MDLQNQKPMNKMAIVSPYLSMITINKVSRLLSPIKRHGMAEWIQNRTKHAACKRLTLDILTER